MISSLANFFMLIFYHGGQPQRVAWTLLMFTMGAVGIARVAIEKDRSYSLGYAGILGIITFVVMLRFLDSAVFCAFILVLIGYLADRIVHDCTLIDDSIDSSGQGLIDSGRLFVKKQIELKRDPDHAEHVDGAAIKTTRGNQRNQPGRTVMYLALGALPLFGLGQFFLHNDDQTWRRAQFLLAIYLFSSLSLLVTTSFLGLRRYLRQRKVDMPSDVSVAWLAGGLAMIAVILSIAYLAPLPGQALATFELPKMLDSPGDLMASKFGWGDEAADKSDPQASSTQNDPNAGDKEIQSITPQEGAPPGDSGDGKGDQGPTGKQKGGKKEPSQGDGPEEGKSQAESDSQSQGTSESKQGDSSQSDNFSPKNGEESSSTPSESGESQSQTDPQSQADSQSQSQADSPPKSDSQSESESQSQPDSKSSQQENQSPQESEDPNSPPESNQQQGNEQQADQRQSDSDASASQDEGSTEQSESGIADAMSDLVPSISGILRLIIFLALIAVVASFLWLNRDAIAQWWRKLFERKPRDIATDSFEEFLRTETTVPPRSFASFRNPFDNEQDPRRIVVITFQAFEAWTREQGSTRGKDETPSEFMRRIGRSLPRVASSASQVVESYNRIVYGRGSATEQDLSAARKVWVAMHTASSSPVS